MKTVSVINYKGGVGKTTIVANIAAVLGWKGEKVLLIDLDPQASLTFSFLNEDIWEKNYAENQTIRNWYDAYIDQDQDLELPSLIVTPEKINRIIGKSDDPGGCVDLICSHLALINIDLELATRLGGASLRQTRSNFLRLHSRLLDGLESKAVQDKYDFVIIDCPPNFNVVTKTAIVASHRILIPAIPDFLSILGIEELRRHIAELVKDFNEFAEQPRSPAHNKIDPSIMGVIPTMTQIYGGQPIKAQLEFINRIKRTGLPVFNKFIRRNNSIYGHAPQYGVPVALLDLDGNVSGHLVSNATYKVIWPELFDLTDEFLDRV